MYLNLLLSDLFKRGTGPAHGLFCCCCCWMLFNFYTMHSTSYASPCGWGMCHDVTTNWFLRICLEHRGPIYLGYNLVCDDYSNAKLWEECNAEWVNVRQLWIIRGSQKCRQGQASPLYTKPQLTIFIGSSLIIWNCHCCSFGEHIF